MVWHKTIGGGPVKVVVIHGWFSDHRVFTPIFDALDTDRYTYVLFDIRGYGHSRDIAGSFTIGEIAADVIALADRTRLDRVSCGRPFDGRQGRAEGGDACLHAHQVDCRGHAGAGFALPFDDNLFGFFSRLARTTGRRLR